MEGVESVEPWESEQLGEGKEGQCFTHSKGTSSKG